MWLAATIRAIRLLSVSCDEAGLFGRDRQAISEVKKCLGIGLMPVWVVEHEEVKL